MASAVTSRRSDSNDSGKVLFVDDDEVTLALMESICKQLGVECRLTSCPEEAVGIFASEEFDVVVSDLNMPGGTGVDLARKLRHLDPQLPVFCFTGGGGMYSWKELDEFFDMVFLKPSDYSRMFAEALKRMAVKKYPGLAPRPRA